MNVAHRHFDLGPLIYGVIMFLGIAVMIAALLAGMFLPLMMRR